MQSRHSLGSTHLLTAHRSPSDSETLLAGANAHGIIDLVGNVWQYTDSEYTDGHTRFVLLRGGSLYQPIAASDVANW